MRVLVLITLFQTYACKEPSKPRSVNLALETVLEFENNENSADVQIIDKVRSFLDQVKLVIDKNKGSRRNLPSGSLKFTDFLKHTLAILSSYEDSDLEDVLTIVDEEIRKYHYKGCKFYELVENINVRRFMANNLDKLKNAPAKEVKNQMKKLLNSFEKKNFDVIQKTVVNYINSLYGAKSESKFKEVLNNLALYRSKSKRSNVNLVKVIRNGIRSIIFDHYSELDSETRRDLKIKLETYWKNMYNSEKTQHHVWNFQPFSRLEKTRDNLRHVDDGVSRSLEIKNPTAKHRKATTKLKHKRKPSEKVKRQRDEPTTERRLTFITLYPEAITFLGKKHRKSRTTKRRETTYYREDGGENYEPKSRSKYRKKPKAVRKIVSEHEAVINVEKETPRNKYTHKRYKKTKHTPLTTEPPRKRYRAINRETKHKDHKTERKQIKNSFQVRRLESEEGLSIDSDFPTKSFRKSNINDTLSVNDTNNAVIITAASNSPVTETDRNVIKRINDLEKELKDVKAKMNKANKEVSYESPRVEKLDFWRGTTKQVKTTTPEVTTRRTTTIKTTVTTSKPKPTTVLTTKLTTKEINETVTPVFRTRKTNDSNAESKLPKKQDEKVLDRNGDLQRNISSKVPMARANFNDNLELNHSADMDYFNDLKEPDMNITGFEDIERYLNETKPKKNDKTEHIVRKKMLEQLKDIFAENPEDELNSTVILSSTAPALLMTDPETIDPINFLDQADDILK